jgi:predicted metal-dependent HD superfamily phosphohydrolase
VTSRERPGVYGIERDLTLAMFWPSYYRTLSRMRPDNSKVTFDGQALHFSDYPFRPASVFPSGAVTAEQVAEVNLASLSQVRLRNGEILFVGHPDKAVLLSFVERFDVDIRRRFSVWSSLLNPFLDTSFEPSQIDGEFQWLERLGLDRQTVTRWRREVTIAMVAYNFGTMLWDWSSLDLYDVLRAQQAHVGRSEFARFYSRAMALAALDPLDEGTPSMTTTLANALYGVLLEWYPEQKVKGSQDFNARWQERHKRVEALHQRLLAQLTAAYSEPHRRYHTVAHIESCLLQASQQWAYAVQLNEIRWALLFHDAIYDTHRQDNEARSADWAGDVMDELQRPVEERERVRSLIMATAHVNEPRTTDEALLLDIDLSVLGADAETFDAYDRAIREEYQWVPEAQYRAARAQVLARFLNRERLYHTTPYRRDREAQARENLRRAIERLKPAKEG